MNRFLPFVFLLLLFSVMGTCFGEDSIAGKIEEMISIYSQSSQKAQDPAFKTKVDELDEELRIRLEKDQDIKPFTSLIESAEQFSARKSARAMFEPILQKVSKRLEFVKAQKEVGDKEFLEKCDEIKTRVDKYLDPNKPDEDTVDTKSIEEKQAALRKKVADVLVSLKKRPEKEIYSVEVMGEDGSPAKLSPLLENSLIGKVKSLVPCAKAAKIGVSMKKEKTVDVKCVIQGFTAPNGFNITEANLDFEGIAMDALKNDSPTEYTGVFDDSTFRRYRSVYDQDQINSLPFFENITYEMETVAPGKTCKIPFVKETYISDLMRSLDGDTRFEIVNRKTALNEKIVELKNLGEQDILFIQGSDKLGICSVKSLGFLKAKEGFLTFSEAFVLVDDQISSDIGKFIGMQAINFALKNAYNKLRKAYPFTMNLEKVQIDNGENGQKLFIFSGKGKVN
ncbi:MAG: hypothetical protein HQM08_12290 [Candidatus Riflebacteria bacterium]|nr:hypothetical protein [Candidatus Riflebacteria bacterium]